MKLYEISFVLCLIMATACLATPFIAIAIEIVKRINKIQEGRI